MPPRASLRTVELGGRLGLLGSPALRVFSIPAGTLNRVLELGPLTAIFAYAGADGPIWAVDKPVVLALRYWLFFFSQSLILPYLRRPAFSGHASPLAVLDGHVRHIHFAYVLQPGPKQYVVFELLYHLNSPSWDAAHGEYGDKQAVWDSQQIVDRP